MQNTKDLIQGTEVYIPFSGLNLANTSVLLVISIIARDERILVPDTPSSKIASLKNNNDQSFVGRSEGAYLIILS